MLKPEDLNPWFYPLTINGKDVPCGIYPPGEAKDRPGWHLVVRQNLRRMIIVGELTKQIDLTGARILDVACNCGLWSSIYIKGYGAKSVVGIEGRELFVNQAKMLYEDLDILDRAEFILGDVMDIDYASLGHFDFVLCAGLLYHITDHENLLSRLAGTGAEHMLLDTRICKTAKTHPERPGLHFNSIETRSKVTIPSLEDIVTIMNGLGYGASALPVPFQYVLGMGGDDNYNAGKRIALLCKSN